MGYNFDGDALIASFRAGGAWIDDEIMALQSIESMGFGAIAKQKIEVSSAWAALGELQRRRIIPSCAPPALGRSSS